jgi:exodeoxyribonuclease VII small subunit
MSDTPSTSTETSIADKQDRLETIIAQLEDGEVSLDRAKTLHEEGTALLDDLRQDLDLGEGTVTERS